jgi:hypothetical protein
MVQCPVCNTMMHETTSFCPGCGAPRTAIRQQLERQAAETGEPYDELLNLARAEDFRQRVASGFSTPAAPSMAPPIYTPPIDRPRKSGNKLWWILGGIGGGILLVCVGCVVIAMIVRSQAGITLGEGDAGSIIRQQLELAEQGRHQERWLLLHPKQRQEVPAENFVSCAMGTTITDFEVFLELNEQRDVPFVGDVKTRAVSYVYTQNGQSYSNVAYVVKDGDDLYWTLTLDEIAAYRTGGCP